MRDLGRITEMEAMHRVLQHAIGLGDALVLTQMLHPRFGEKRFEDASLFGGVSHLLLTTRNVINHQ